MLYEVITGFWVSRIDGYVIQSIADVGASINPLMKEVSRALGAWFSNYGKTPILWLIPALAYLGGFLVIACVRAGWTLLAFVGSSLACVSVILTAGVALFPFVLPSSEMPKASLTAWDATSVITSYSIHYTKLYESPFFRPDDFVVQLLAHPVQTLVFPLVVFTGDFGDCRQRVRVVRCKSGVEGHGVSEQALGASKIGHVGIQLAGEHRNNFV